jgi:hypothetical protein
MPSQSNTPSAQAAQSGFQEWVLVLLESLGVGIFLVILLLAAVLLVIGLYVQVVWPLTDWDLVNVSLEQYQSLIELVLVTVFTFGFFGGYYCISGAAWKKIKPKTEAPAKGTTSQRAISRYRQ